MYYYVSIELTNTYIIHIPNRQHIMYHIYKWMVFWVLPANRYIIMALCENNTKTNFPV